GAAKPVPVDVRVIAATHRALDDLVEEKRFRADLFMRLAGFRLTLPPLRERREDLGALVAELLARTAKAAAPSLRINARAARALLRYEWPGNVRELERALGLAVVLATGEPVATPADGAELRVEHLPPPVRAALDPDDDTDDEAM